MDAFMVLLTAVGLAMDCLSVSIASGLAARKPRIIDALKMASSFGFFQAFMPVLGWLGGLSMVNLISGIDHWIAFGLLSLIGGKMIYESTMTESSEKGVNSQNLYVLLTLSVATSIDALAVGLSFAFLRVSIEAPVVVIGAVSFLLSFLGVYVGGKLGRFIGRKIGIAGGLILIGIGIRILAEHLL